MAKSRIKFKDENNNFIGIVQDVVVNSTTVVDDDGTANIIIPTLLSDLQDDSTHRLVTDNEKTTWNNKQNSITSSNKLSSDLITDASNTNKFVTEENKTTWNNKQDAILDLDNIRSGATLGLTALQPNAISDMATKTWISDNGYVKNIDFASETVGGVIRAGNIYGLQMVTAGSGTGQLTSVTRTYQDYLTSYDIMFISKGTLENVITGKGILLSSDIINDTSHTDTDKPLSAYIGNVLQEEINNLKARGRFLSLWNCATGLPTSDPQTSPYEYQTGDYYIIGNKAGGYYDHTVHIEGKDLNDNNFFVDFVLQTDDSYSTAFTTVEDIGNALIESGYEEGNFLQAHGEIEDGVDPGIASIVRYVNAAAANTVTMFDTNKMELSQFASISEVTITDTVSGSTVNYRPEGTSYVIGTPSTTIETESVNIDDVYYFDGTGWRLQVNTRKEISFSNITGQPTDNVNLADALNNKVGKDDIPSETTAGAMKIYEPYQLKFESAGNAYCGTISYNDYQSASISAFISRGTLENVVEGKKLIECVTGTSAPTTSTVCSKIGALYMDTANNYKLYQCTQITTIEGTLTYTWRELVTEVPEIIITQSQVISMNPITISTTSSQQAILENANYTNIKVDGTALGIGEAWVTRTCIVNNQIIFEMSANYYSSGVITEVGSIGLVYNLTTKAIVYSQKTLPNSDTTINSSSTNNTVSTSKAVYDYTNNNFLNKGNTTAFTPTLDYHPATKLYVDTKAVSFKPFPDEFITNQSTETFFDSVLETSPATGMVYLGGVEFTDMPEGLMNSEVELYVYPGNVLYAVMRSADISPYHWECNNFRYRGWEGVDKTAKDYANTNFLNKTNTTAFTPTTDYHPATKKYVDDATSSAGSYYIPLDILDLDEASSSEEIIAALGGDKIEEIITTILAKKSIAIASDEGVLVSTNSAMVISNESTNKSIMLSYQVFDGSHETLYIVSITKENDTYSFVGLIDNIVTHSQIEDLEHTSHKVTSISSSSTNTQYPSAKAVYDYIQSLDAREVAY